MWNEVFCLTYVFERVPTELFSIWFTWTNQWFQSLVPTGLTNMPGLTSKSSPVATCTHWQHQCLWFPMATDCTHSNESMFYHSCVTIKKIQLCIRKCILSVIVCIHRNIKNGSRTGPTLLQYFSIGRLQKPGVWENHHQQWGFHVPSGGMWVNSRHCTCEHGVLPTMLSHEWCVTTSLEETM